MKRKSLAMLLTLTMLLGMLPTTALAAAPQEQTVEIEQVTVQTSDIDLPDNDELFAGYVHQLFYPEDGGASLFGNYGESSGLLSADQKAIYDGLKQKIKEVAEQGGETTFYPTIEGSDTSNFFTIRWETTTTDEKQLSNELQEQFRMILDCLMVDCPYELYWYDKTTNGAGYSLMSPTASDGVASAKIGNFRFTVAAAYQDGSNLKVNAAKSQTAVNAAANAQQIVQTHAEESDYQKLLSYKEEICTLTSYHQSASGYGDPWQLIYVFDEDPATEVVCEGYSKAFQYLCDLSQFEDPGTVCYTVMGGIPGAHMWNIVTLEGQNYLVDVTNSDTGTIGQNGGLFLAGTEGSVDTGYQFVFDASNDITYQYDQDTKDLYGNTILALASANYDESGTTLQPIDGTVTIDGTAKIGEMLTANVTDSTVEESLLQFQWYRGDTLIEDANTATYTPSTEADVGQFIKVEVTADGYSGKLEASTTGVVGKADGPAAPAQPTATATHDTITVAVVDGQEYACVTGEAPTEASAWQASAEFTGLTENTAYKVYARVSETATHNASAASQAFEISTTAAPISAVTVTVDAPVKGQDLAETATVSVPETGVTASISWYEGETVGGNAVSGEAKPDTVYTAQLRLTATANPGFANPTAVTLNGDSAQNLKPDAGGTLILTKTFPATEGKAVTQIAVTAQPTKLEYIEGESFDPAGMVVTATYDDGSTAEVSEYTVSPEILTVGTTAVTITYAGQTASVSGITVLKKPAVTDFTITLPENAVYDESARTAMIAANSNITGMGEITVKYNGATTAPVDAGTYTVTFDVAKGTHYAAAADLPAGSFTIEKAALTITATDPTVKIGATAALAVSVAPIDLPLSYQSKDPSIATVDENGTVTGVAVGSTQITIACAGNENYQATEKTVAVTVIDKTPIAVTFDAKTESLPYIPSGYALGEQFEQATVAEDKTAQYRYDGKVYDTLAKLPTVTTAGTYTVTAFYEDETYYGEQPASFTITKADQAPLTITSATTVTFGETLQLSAAGGSGTGTVVYTIADDTGSAIINGDVLTPTKAGTVMVTATRAADENYHEITSEPVTITIRKADAAQAMQTASGTIVAGAAGAVTLPALPDGAAYGTPATGSTDAVTGLSLSGDRLTYTGGSAVQVGTAYTVTIAVAESTNYNAYTITVTLTGSSKITPTLTVEPISVTYTGREVPASAIKGTAKAGTQTVSGTWSWVAAAPKNVADSGAHTVSFTPEDTDAYASGTATVQVTIAKATPTGTPKYTAVSASGKTLADANLTTAGGTFSIPGKVAWTLPLTTAVTANTAYQWEFTPDDHQNYTTLTGKITLWTQSQGGDSDDDDDDDSGTVSQPSTSGGTSTVTASVGSSTSGTTASATISGSALDKAVERVLDAADRNATDPVVKISVDVSSRADSIKLTLPVAALETLGDHTDAVLTILTDVAEVTFDSDAIHAIASQAGSSVTLQVEPVASSALNSRQRQAVGSAPVFDVSLRSGSDTISSFSGGSATVTLPYSLKSGQDANRLVVWYVDSDGVLTPCDTSYNMSRREVTFITTHFSKYAIGYEESTQDEEQESIPVPGLPWFNPYADVPSHSWYYDAVQFVAERGLMSGTAATRFSPDEITDRAMLVTILWRQAGRPSSGTQARFQDVDPFQWYGSAVHWAASNYLVNGYDSNTFGPEDTITREQLAAILYRYAQYKGLSVSATGNLNQYTDAGQISAYAKTAFQWICSRGIMQGTSATTLSPTESATRAQVAAILMRFCETYHL